MGKEGLGSGHWASERRRGPLTPPYCNETRTNTDVERLRDSVRERQEPCSNACCPVASTLSLTHEVIFLVQQTHISLSARLRLSTDGQMRRPWGQTDWKFFLDPKCTEQNTSLSVVHDMLSLLVQAGASSLMALQCDLEQVIHCSET